MLVVMDLTVARFGYGVMVVVLLWCGVFDFLVGWC